jgi:multiple antibiotic resistance protein
MAIIEAAFIWAAFIGILAIVNPLSTAIVFLSLTGRDSDEKRRKMAKRAVIISAGVLIFFMVSGNLIFDTFSITIEAFKIAGGLLIARLGFRMLDASSKEQSEEEQRESKKKDDISIMPLAVPLLSGPGAITTSLVWMSQAPGINEKLALLTIPLVIATISYIALVNAKVLQKAFGTGGINLLEKFMGLIVIVMGIQFIINGLVDLNVINLIL